MKTWMIYLITIILSSLPIALTVWFNHRDNRIHRDLDDD